MRDFAKEAFKLCYQSGMPNACVQFVERMLRLEQRVLELETKEMEKVGAAIQSETAALEPGKRKRVGETR